MDEKRIKWLIKQNEKETIEFKEFEKLDNRTESVKKDLAKLFAAFSNKKGGMVLFGVTDDRKLEGYNLTEEKFKEFEQSLIQIAATKCKPPIYIENITHEIVSQSSILIVEVPMRSSTPHTVDDVFYIRISSHNIPITDPTKIKELLNERKEIGEEKMTKQLEEEKIELGEILSPNILIGNNDVPYFKIKSKYSLNCLIFSDAEGYSNGAYYNKTTIDPITIEDMEKILKEFYSIFGRRGYIGLHDSSFLINQVCNDTKVSDSWFGYGPKNFIQALKEQSKRYAQAEFTSPHHNEVAGYVDVSNRDDFIFYVGVQPSVIKEYRRDIILEHVEIGFVFESMPFDNRRFINFFEKANLKVPDYIRYEDSYLDFKREYLSKDSNLKNEGLVVYKSGLDQEYFVSKAICNNPFYGIKNINQYLSEHEKIIINLSGGHHQLAEKKKYFLEEFKSIPIPYGGFQFVLLNIRGNW